MFSTGSISPTEIGIFSVLSLVAGPLLCMFAIAFSATRRHRPRLLLPAVIPLALTSVSLQLAVAAMMVVSGFSAIAVQKGSMTAFLKSTFASSAGPLLWRFVEAGACVVIAMAIAPWMWGRSRRKVRRTESQGGEAPTGHDQRSLPHPGITIAWSAAALIAVFALVWLYHDIVEFCVILVDPCRAADAAQFRNMRTSDIGGVAETLGRRIATLGYSAFALTPFLAGIGFYCLHAIRRTRWGFAASLAFAAVALAWCGMSVSAEWSARSYLRAQDLNIAEAHPVYHAYSRTLVGYILPAKSKTDQHRDRDFQLPPAINSFPMLDADKEDAVVVTITNEKQLLLGSAAQPDTGTIPEKVKDLLNDRPYKRVYVRGDARAPIGTVLQLFGQLLKANVDDIGLLTSSRTPKTNPCITAGLEVLIPPPRLSAVPVADPPSFGIPLATAVVYAPAVVPASTGPGDPIVIQILHGTGGVQWKINRKDVSGLSGVTAQLETLLRDRPEKVAFLAADENLPFSDFIDTVDAGVGAGLEKVGVVIDKIQ